jgi:hypothetical protein
MFLCTVQAKCESHKEECSGSSSSWKNIISNNKISETADNLEFDGYEYCDVYTHC